MNYEKLRDFIENEMSMTHIYQPVIIKKLLESDGNMATTEDIARDLLNRDSSQLEYWKNRLGVWPRKILKEHNVVSYKKKTYTLLLDGSLSESEARTLTELCEGKIREFVEKDPWIIASRKLDKRSVSGSMRYDVISAAKGRCVACGNGPPNVSLHVDHIVPIALGGPDERSNLQALCVKCNTQKRERDETDFILWKKRLQFRRKRCWLCKDKTTLMENVMAYAIEEGQDILVSPHRHVGSFIGMIPAERQLCMTLVDQMMNKMRLEKTAEKFDVSGFDYNGKHCCISITPH